MSDRFDQGQTVFARGWAGEFGPELQARRLAGDAPDVMWRTLFGESRHENVIAEQLAGMVDGRTFPGPRPDLDPVAASRWVKDAAHWFGASLVGIAPLSPSWVYSRRGMKSDIREGRLGDPISLEHKFAISLAVPMDYRRLQASPSYLTDAEVALGYVRVGMVACMLAGAIRELGYPARAHYLRREEVLHVPIAVAAGVGEPSRMGILITGRYGPRVRLATVTTDLELFPDERSRLGVQEFCRVCKKCARHCPSRAVPDGDPGPDGRWLIDPDRCYAWWNERPELWSSCANCITVCPWNKPDTWYHGAAVRMCGLGPAFSRPLLWLDDLLYPRPHLRNYRLMHYCADATGRVRSNYAADPARRS